jgi:tetratricopeptide (TPR) repeat protein
MQNNKSVIHHALIYFITFITAIIPVLFLPITQEFFTTNKFYMLAFGMLIALAILTIQMVFSKSIKWERKPYDGAVLLLIIGVALSLLIVTPNKVEGVLSPNFGLASVMSLSLLYFFLSRFNSHEKKTVFNALAITTSLAAIVSIVFFFKPFANVSLPAYITFLKNPYFTLLGTPLETMLFIGFFLTYALVVLFNEKAGDRKHNNTLLITVAVTTFISILMLAYNLFKPQTGTAGQALLMLPPFRLSWYAAVEILKTPLSAIFGVGIGNFSALFTAVKDGLYNQTSLWQVETFALSRSAMLHILTETGILTFVAFALIVYQLVKSTFFGQHKSLLNKALVIYILAVLALFPLSLPILFLFFLVISHVMGDYSAQSENHVDTYNSIETSAVLPLHIALILISIVFIGISGYVVGRGYIAEFYFKKSLDGFTANNARALYDNQRNAIMNNPYLDKYRLSFGQTNLLIANNIAGKDKTKLTDADRQTIAQAIQAAISEAKAAVTLNPSRAANWENLAGTYRNVLTIAQGADVWTISAYQRAIILDPNNPVYRVGLGGVYYSLGNYNEAVKLFEQATALKSDWSNAHYNLAWASYQSGDYNRAASEMQTVTTLLDPVRDEADYKKAKQDLADFKAKIAKTDESKKPTTDLKETPKKLSLPTPPVATLSPKIELPKTASPEAK